MAVKLHNIYKKSYLRCGDGVDTGDPGDGANDGAGEGVAFPPSMTPGGGVGGVKYPDVWLLVFMNVHLGSWQQSGSLVLGTNLHSLGSGSYFGHLINCEIEFKLTFYHKNHKFS